MSWKIKRKEARVLLSIPVSIEGVDEANTAFREEAVTENVSKHGVCIVVDRLLRLETVITVTAFQGKFKCRGEIRAVWVDDYDRKKRIGVQFIEPVVNWVVA